VTRIYVV